MRQSADPRSTPEPRSARGFGRSAILYGGAVGAKVIAGVAVVKLVALIAEPAKLGQLGQLMSLVAVVSMLAGGGVSNGVIARLAALERHSRPWYRHVNAAVLIWIISSVTIGLVLVTFARPLTALALGGQGTQAVIWLLAGTQVLLGLNNLLQAIFSSQKQVTAYSVSNMAGSMIGLAAFFALWWFYRFDGVVYGLVAMPCFAVIFSIWLTVSRRNLYLHQLKIAYQPAESRILLRYSVSGLVAAALIPISQLVVRVIVAHEVGWEPVGYWQASLKVSEVHLQFFGVLLINYILPDLSAAQGPAGLAGRVRSAYRTLIPVFLMGALAIFLLRDLVVQWVLAPQYAPMRDYLGPQLVGDLLKLIGIIPGYVFLARGKVRLYLVSETAQAILYVAIVAATAGTFLRFTPVYAYVIAQGLFLIWVIPVLRKVIASDQGVYAQAGGR